MTKRNDRAKFALVVLKGSSLGEEPIEAERVRVLVAPVLPYTKERAYLEVVIVDDNTIEIRSSPAGLLVLPRADNVVQIKMRVG